jgi:hypothetical protein
MTTPMRVYLAAWCVACVVAAVLVLRDRGAHLIARRDYWRWLLRPWKVATFVVAGTGMTFIAPLSGDPTWDHVDGAIMSALTFATAPWSVGVLYRLARRLPLSPPPQRALARGYVVACAWLLSASWSYDGYLIFRDGRYPASWSATAIVSSFLYALAGLFWSLEVRDGRPALGFTDDAWPSVTSGSRGSAKLALVAIAVALVFAALLSPFLWNAYQELRHR